jgi:ubiquinone/menaquinone biosynthesis C-methylase UbiE
MNPADYDAWYNTPRGCWIGEVELALLWQLLAPAQEGQVLDVGCGTGWFTRQLAARLPGKVVGLDLDPAMLAYARSRGGGIPYLEGDALSLPFPNASMDAVVSVTSLCFVANWQRALAEMVRVARRRIVLGLLNRHSLLYLQKGLRGGSGAYRGAHWHTQDEVLRALADLPVTNVQTPTAVFLPSGTPSARWLENNLPAHLSMGGFLAVAADVVT